MPFHELAAYPGTKSPTVGTSGNTLSRRRLPWSVSSFKPSWSYQNQHDLAFRQALLKHRREFHSRAHIHVDKHVLAAKFVFQILADAERIRGRVLTAVTNENLLCHVKFGLRLIAAR